VVNTIEIGGRWELCPVFGCFVYHKISRPFMIKPVSGWRSALNANLTHPLLYRIVRKELSKNVSPFASEPVIAWVGVIVLHAETEKGEDGVKAKLALLTKVTKVTK
jgi:hypothetical protein